MPKEITTMTKSCARDLTDRINANFDDLAGMLVRARDGKAWEALGYDSWTSYLNGEISVCRRQVYNLLELEEVKKTISKSLETNTDLCTIVHNKEVPTTKAQTRPLGTLEPDKQPEAWSGAVEAAGGSQPTAKQVEAAVEVVKAKAPKPVPKPAAPEDKELADAIKEIGRILGKQAGDGIKSGVLNQLKRADILAFSKLAHDEMRAIEPLIFGERMTLRQALGFLNTMPHHDTRVYQLEHYCIAGGGFYEATIDGFKFTIEHVNRKY